jgi:redox-sensing transcriptional repressor
MKHAERIPPRVIPRLSRYYRILREYDQKTWISSRELSLDTGFTDAQIRRDLAYFGQFGQPGKGYIIEELKKSIKAILGLDKQWNVLLVGVGNLGTALLRYKGFREQGFEIVAAIDADASKAGKIVNGVKIYPMGEINGLVKNKKIQMGILTVPEEVAQKAAENLVGAGIKSIFNFAPIHLKLPVDVQVRHIDMTIELERLSFMSTRD